MTEQEIKVLENKITTSIRSFIITHPSGREVITSFQNVKSVLNHEGYDDVTVDNIKLVYKSNSVIPLYSQDG